MESINPLFQLVLADYPIAKIEKAFAFYLKFNSEMPTPADIVTIIERNGRPPFDKSVYIAVCKKNADERTSEEWRYKEDYERFIITGDM